LIFSQRSPLLNQIEYRKNVENSLIQAEHKVTIVSAFIKIAGLNWVKKLIKKNISVRVLCRWTELDILQKSSDLEIYNFCRINNWEFKIMNNLHAKIICIDDKILFMGSNNLTNRGMCLLGNSNEEIGIKTFLEQEEKIVIENLFNKSITVNQSLYELYRSWLEKNNKNYKSFEFSDDIKKYQTIDLDNLWVKDFPSTNSSYFMINFHKDIEEIEHTKEILNIYQNQCDIELISNQILKSKIFKWVKNQMDLLNVKEFYFGELSNLIHNELKDDPTPYRKTLKELQQNLYSFLKVCNSSRIKIDIPYRHSERLTIYDK